MSEAPAVEQHRPLVTQFLEATQEDFRIIEAIARNASAVLSRQEARRVAREDSRSSE